MCCIALTLHFRRKTILGFTVKRIMEERRLIFEEGKENTNINSVAVSAITLLAKY